ATAETADVEPVLGKVTNVTTPYGKKLTVSTITDRTGSLNLVWFNQHYLKNTLQEQKTYTVSGRIALYKNKKCIFSPEYEPGEGGLVTGRLVGIYPETAGISSKWLRSRNNDVVKQLQTDQVIAEFLPPELLTTHNFPPLTDCLCQIHFPHKLTDAENARERLAFEELFLELLKVEHRKQQWQQDKDGCKICYAPHAERISALIASLPFKLTKSQETALTDIYHDLEQDNPMNRLLEGDVGSGKTIVSLIISYLTYLNGYKTVVMAPTEILAAQHFATFSKFITQNFDPDTKIVQKTNTKNTKLTQEDDIIIGTHALLYSQESIQKLGLVIIDEQQRFGVEQRSLLLNMTAEKTVPNLLSMTATPIPRTLALTIYGDLDISTIKPHTQEGRKIRTKVTPEAARTKLYQWIKAQDQPAFIVCPFINQSANADFENVKAAEKEFKELQNILPKDQMRLIHSKIRNSEKEAAVEAFRLGEIRYLVSTPVVEVGIDVPEASIIVIESAERYGLASLHQLRGRVGRLGQQGYCFLVYTGNSSRSRERLQHLEKVHDGTELAEIDLKMRGQGDIFGTMQSGVKNFKIASVFNIELLEKAKKEAQKYFPILNRYPQLKKKVEETGKFVGQN
ncbi:ATP-dependent DNA helicase RecG, partial [Patescibacteria group bacterium]|nr:ATP-dependent DNA helicase RecG [Patescibacteria group bacterium]